MSRIRSVSPTPGRQRIGKLAAGSSAGRVENKIAVVIGAAQGFGEARAYHEEQGANIVVADLNESWR